MRSFEVSSDDLLLDPWNGAGTTTQVAQDRGVPAVGFDINPAAVVVAKGRNLHSGVLGSIRSLTAEITYAARESTQTCVLATEPLETWFCPTTARTIRALEVTVQRFLASLGQYQRIVELDSLEPISDLAAFFYTAIFRMVRSLLRPFRTSNPTWIKRGTVEPKLVVSKDDLLSTFQFYVVSMIPCLASRELGPQPARVTLDVASSTMLPVKTETVSAVVTSPPYCTRIDYAVTTCPELAVLGLNFEGEFKRLRDKTIGTPTINSDVFSIESAHGETCLKFVRSVDRHPTKAARSYYLKTYTQYFGGLFASIKEISRVLSPGGKVAFVVQDSYFKDLRIDLGQIVQEMSSSVGLTTNEKYDFPARRTMSGVHKHAKKYRSSFDAVESVVLLSKGSGRRKFDRTDPTQTRHCH